jgi:type IV secretory pathway TraG/TraD family ATPase VirD4
VNENDNQITYFAQTNYRNTNTPFGIKQADRLLHTYIIGKTGTGKTTLLQTKIRQDVEHGRGLCLIDPHGDLITAIQKSTPDHRKADVVYLDLTDPNQPYGYNPLRKVSYEKRSLIASSILETLKKLWNDAWGVKLEHILRFTLLALLDQPQSDISEIPKMLMDKGFRNTVLKNVVNQEVANFWKKEFPRYSYYDILPALNKIGGLLAYPAIKRVLVDNTKRISLRTLMDEQKIVLVNLSKGAVGEDVAHILGAVLLTSIASAAFSRVNVNENERVPFFVYLDEFQNFTTLSLVNMLSELRKYKVGMIMAHQYLDQLDPDIKSAVLGNVGTHISFRVDAFDATLMAKKMYPVFDVEDFINLPNYHMYLTLMIDGTPSRPFSAISIPYIGNF